MAKSYDYQSAFDIIGPVMIGPLEPVIRLVQ